MLDISERSLARHFREVLVGLRPGGVEADREWRDEERQLVRCGVAMGIPQDDIARVLKISPVRLREDFPEELSSGAAEANIAVGNALYRQATVAGNVRAQMFWLRAKCGWREGGVFRPEGSIDEADMLDELRALDDRGLEALDVLMRFYEATDDESAEPRLSAVARKPGDRLQ